jgi:hypothetical protein
MFHMTAKQFEQVTGYKPIQDDLIRVTCLEAGTMGHDHCGWCEAHWKPRFMCGCLASKQLQALTTTIEPSLEHKSEVAFLKALGLVSL